MSIQLVKTTVLDVDITNATKEEVLEYISEVLAKKTKKLFVTTPNPEIVVAAQSHPELMRLLNDADLALCDGVGLLLAGYFLGKGLKERITGIDMIDLLCQLGVDQGLSIGLLGAGPGVAERAAKCLIQKYPRLNIVFVAPEWSEEGFIKKEVSSIEYLVSSKDKSIPNTKYLPAGRHGQIRRSEIASAPVVLNTKIDMLFVAYGFPKQEQWIAQYLPKLPIRLAMGVGGSFDMLSGEIARAPFLMRMIGFEWLYRLIRQPWRWRRQLSLLSFIKLVFMAKLSLR